MDRKLQAKEKLIYSYLQSKGYSPVSSKSKGKFYVYLSPLHNENNPSFFVDKDRNLWKDYGFANTKWDDIITLVMQMERLDFHAAIDSLIDRRHVGKHEKIEYEFKPGLSIDDVSPLTNPTLISYLQGRNVNIDIAKLYCEQAVVRFLRGQKPDKTHLYISFKNDKGGYEFRNQYSIDIAKVSSSPKYFTRFMGVPDQYSLFEGFIDFLTHLTRLKKEKLSNTAVVLNSLVNMLYLYQTLSNNKVNDLYFDNDGPADKYIYKGDEKNKIVSLKDQGIVYTDKRNTFPHANDINDYALGKFII